jgi:hypothetical protein
MSLSTSGISSSFRNRVEDLIDRSRRTNENSQIEKIIKEIKEIKVVDNRQGCCFLGDLITASKERDNGLIRISQSLAECGKIDQAVIAAEAIRDFQNKGHALINIVRNTHENNQIERVIQAAKEMKAIPREGYYVVADLINSKEQQDYVLNSISDILTQRGNMKRASEVVTEPYHTEVQLNPPYATRMFIPVNKFQ